MADFSDFIGTVNSLMDDFGLDATYTTILSLGEYDPALGTAPVSVGQIPIRAIMMDAMLRSNGLGVKDGTTIVAGDKILYVRPTDYLLPILMPSGVLEVDTADDRVIVAGVTYKVVKMKAIDPNATGTQPILYELYLRR
jgi:hypothetical protein